MLWQADPSQNLYTGILCERVELPVTTCYNRPTYQKNGRIKKIKKASVFCLPNYKYRLICKDHLHLLRASPSVHSLREAWQWKLHAGNCDGKPRAEIVGPTDSHPHVHFNKPCKASRVWHLEIFRNGRWFIEKKQWWCFNLLTSGEDRWLQCCACKRSKARTQAASSFIFQWFSMVLHCAIRISSNLAPGWKLFLDKIYLLSKWHNFFLGHLIKWTLHGIRERVCPCVCLCVLIFSQEHLGHLQSNSVCT